MSVVKNGEDEDNPVCASINEAAMTQRGQGNKGKHPHPHYSSRQVQRTERRKLVIVGDGACGKTSLLMVYTSGNFPEVHVPTIFETSVTSVQLGHVEVDLALWDTAGQEDYDRLRPVSYPDTDVVLICFSVDVRDSFFNVTAKWLTEIQHHCPGVPIVLVGTKCDLRQSSVVGGDKKRNTSSVFKEEGAVLAKRIGAKCYLETSAKTGDGVSDLFQRAAEVALNFKRQPPKRSCCIT